MSTLSSDIITDKVILRNFQESDLDDLYEYCSQEGVGEAAGWPHHKSIKDSKELLNVFINNKNQYAIVYKENNKVIGHIGVYKDSQDGRDDTKELGYVLNKNYWRKGIMTEVILAILECLFSRDIKNIYACCFKENKASKALIEKCGFRLEGEGDFYSEKLKKVFSSFEYIYTKDIWFNKQDKSI